ncbi:hypothetical protein JTB14_015685 [Gonioctena quinquepunctata]|nr:hypothetical protein JTB14_015685 [Gonioctena quinquepunctata]
MKYILFLCLFLQTVRSQEANLQKNRFSEEKIARCCAQHLSCCKKTIESTNFEVRAILTKCQRSHKTYEINACKKTPPTADKRKRYVPDGPICKSQHSGVTNCKKKIKLTIKVKNTGITNCKKQYIVIDHVFDSETQQKQKILYPYVLRIQQKPILQTYELSIENLVNSQAKEKVHNKQEPGFTGCNVNPFKTPTCRSVEYRNQPVPYSTGFCCSCDNKNPRSSHFSGSVRMDSPYETPKKKKNTFHVGEIAGNNYGVDGNLIHNVQKRGGQDCNDKYTPPNVNPETYHDSAHCLEFSDIWYGVYGIEKPKLRHSISLHIFEKYQDAEGGCKWRDFNKMSPIEIGTEVRGFVNDQATIIANYSAKDVNEHSFSLNRKLQRLMIPDTSNIPDARQYPESRGGPPEYLVVKESQVQANGKTCNVAGVGYEAFAKQPNRCAVSKGTCLKNQPRQMWQQDHDLEVQGKKGSYFLKNYGMLPEEPVASNCTGGNKTLTMYFTECHTSFLDVEFRADRNTVLRPSSLAIITEVYVESSNPKKTTITAKIFNSGLVSGVFLVGLSDCPLDLPASFNNIHTKQVLIAPQHQHIYNLEIVCPLSRKLFYCSLQVLNEKQQLIAMRKIRMQRGDRCICIWHCACTCLIVDEGLKCRALSLGNYHAAGFQGSLPIPLHIVQYTFLDDMISMMLYVLLFLCFTLLLMGVTKGMIGCCMVPVGLWGLDLVLDLPKRMNKYLEADISHRTVVYDEKGWPLHPDTKQRVRNIPLAAEFCSNVIFFIICPFVVIWTMMKRLCTSSYATNTESEYICYCKEGTAVQKKSSSLQNSLSKNSSKINVN